MQYRFHPKKPLCFSGGVMDRVVSQLLAELDGVAESETKVFVIGKAFFHFRANLQNIFVFAKQAPPTAPTSWTLPYCAPAASTAWSTLARTATPPSDGASWAA